MCATVPASASWNTGDFSSSGTENVVGTSSTPPPRVCVVGSPPFSNCRLKNILSAARSSGHTVTEPGDDESEDYPVQQLLDLSAKYDVSPETFLMKCLLQFGCLIGLTLGGGGKSSHQDFFLNQVSRLCHPFVHRKLYVSATHVLSLQIDPADLDVVAAASEQSEAVGDASWLCHAAAKSDVRILTFDSSG
eukprot:gene27682-34444_t